MLQDDQRDKLMGVFTHEGIDNKFDLHQRVKKMVNIKAIRND